MSESRNRTLAADHDAVPRGGTTVPAQDCRELDCLDRDTTRALAELLTHIVDRSVHVVTHFRKGRGTTVADLGPGRIARRG